MKIDNVNLNIVVSDCIIILSTTKQRYFTPVFEKYYKEISGTYLDGDIRSCVYE